MQVRAKLALGIPDVPTSVTEHHEPSPSSSDAEIPTNQNGMNGGSDVVNIKSEPVDVEIHTEPAGVSRHGRTLRSPAHLRDYAR